MNRLNVKRPNRQVKPFDNLTNTKQFPYWLYLEVESLYLSGVQVLQSVSLVQIDEAFYRYHLFPSDEEEQHQVLQKELGVQLIHQAERDAGQQGEEWGAQGHHHGYGTDAAANRNREDKQEKVVVC